MRNGISGWTLLAALSLLLILTYFWRARCNAAKEEEKQYREDLSRADYEGMTAETE